MASFLQKRKYTILTIITCTFLQLTPYMMDNLDSMDDPDIQKEISAGSQNYIQHTIPALRTVIPALIFK